MLAVWTGSADLANLDALVTPDYVGFIGSRRRDLARLKTDIEAYRTAAPGVAFSIEQQFRNGDDLATRLTAHRVDAAHPNGETIRGPNISRWQNGLLAEEWAIWESFSSAD